DTFADRTVGDASMEGPFILSSDALREGENVVAVEVHQINAGSSDVVFGLSLQAEGTLAPFTPGQPNSVRSTLPPFPDLWLNEVQSVNASGIIDRNGEQEPWVELFHGGALSTALDGYFLSDNFADLTRWAFPLGAGIAGNTHFVVWADGEPQETTPQEWHAGFRLAAGGGSVALCRLQNGQPAVVDYLHYPAMTEDQAFGSVPDGQAQQRQILPIPTPGAPNQFLTPPVIEEVFLTNDGLLGLTWTSLVGARYRVEKASEIPSEAWTTLAELVATGDRTSFVDRGSAGAAVRFYRIALLTQP
ncbi:MAG TPA: hypothetical protein PK256_09045, partial [Verrucomicrobiota bacterium]|nr:hypothetical protein [Verrucomicrobiota bacterium]